ncbi:MAG: hypothetical protein ISS25_04320 [Nanoarchaeota archaeon]|nr:hypothetical protein [DPANN group archaeon]MBL7117026.1 hypothetical protein [Nanoarchaeota archaeon]
MKLQKNKKAQAAMEFLMTYGWAILIVLVAVAALAYFGVIDQSKRIPEICLFEPGLDCIETAVVDASADSVTFMLINNRGSTITIKALTDDVNDECDSPTMMGCTGTSCTPQNTPFTAVNNAKIRFVVTCGGTDIVPGRFKLNPIIVYSTSASLDLNRTAPGQIVARVS